MTASDSIRYRLALANGFLQEARQDSELARWRSCVDNSQLAVENAGKALLLPWDLFTQDSAAHALALAERVLARTSRVLKLQESSSLSSPSGQPQEPPDQSSEPSGE